jgi:hypothetical protein
MLVLGKEAIHSLPVCCRILKAMLHGAIIVSNAGVGLQATPQPEIHSGRLSFKVIDTNVSKGKDVLLEGFVVLFIVMPRYHPDGKSPVGAVGWD